LGKESWVSIKYLTKKKRAKNGQSYWALTPPIDYRRACDARVEYFDDGRTARFAAIALEKKVNAFRKGQLEDFHLSDKSNLWQLRAAFLSQENVKNLTPRVYNNYKRLTERICETKRGERNVGQLKVIDVNHKIGSEIFDSWVRLAPHTRDKMKKLFNMMFEYATSQDLSVCIPMKYVTVKTDPPRSVVWTRKEVDRMVTHLMSSFDTRNLGILFILCYEWAQRPIDIRHLKWDNIDFETNTCTIKQTKKGAEVYLPIDHDLRAILLKQKEDFGFQPYVCPMLGSDKVWKPYSRDRYTDGFKKAKEELGLNQDLRLGDLRKTAITEMVEAGLTEINIKPVTGHKNLGSISPYVKHTRRAAEAALTKRKQDN
jgi:integrase